MWRQNLTSTWCENLSIKFIRGNAAQMKLMFFLRLDVFVIQYTALHFCFVNFRTRRVIKYLRHSRFKVLSPCVPQQRTKVRAVWLSFICHTAGRLTPESDARLVSLINFLTTSCSNNQYSSVTAQALINPVEALCILDGDVKFLPQLLKRLIRRQVQSIEALRGEREKTKRGNKK